MGLNVLGYQSRLLQRCHPACFHYAFRYGSQNKSIFLDEVASSKLNLHGGFFRKCGHLGLFEAKLMG